MYLPFKRLLLNEDTVKKLGWLYEDLAIQEEREAEIKYRQKVNDICKQFELEEKAAMQQRQDLEP